MVEDWGLTYQHIQLALMSPEKEIGWRLKVAYLSLYTILYIDQDPFLPFEMRESKCHSWNRISEIATTSQSHHHHHHASQIENS